MANYSKMTRTQVISKMSKMEVNGQTIPQELIARFDEICEEYARESRERLAKASEKVTDDKEED
ncbi:MAG: hypothetical protein ACRCX8_14220 [Sarcina sp.]